MQGLLPKLRVYAVLIIAPCLLAALIFLSGDRSPSSLARLNVVFPYVLIANNSLLLVLTLAAAKADGLTPQ